MKQNRKGTGGPPPNRQRHWGDISVGVLGVALGMAAVTIEVARNYEFGASKGIVVGLAVGLAAVPAVAAKTGWNTVLRTLFAACLVLTGYFGVAYYAQGILDKANAAKNATAQYRDARNIIDTAERERVEAFGEAGRISELAAPEQLAALGAQADKAAAQADADADKEAGNQFCGNICRGHRTKADGYRKEASTARERLALAQAKQDALSRAARAQDRMDKAREAAKGGEVNAAPIATLIAMQATADAQVIAGFIDFAEPVAMVLAMLLFASLIDRSLGMVVSGLGFGEAARQQDAKPTVVERIKEHKASLPVLASSEDRIRLFIKRCLGEGECSGGAMMEGFGEWWRMTYPGDTMPSMVVVSRTLVAAGIAKAKVGGRVRYSAGLKQALPVA